MTTNTLVICHGKCEMVICKRLEKLLRMQIATYANNNGEETITISQLPELLSTGIFASESALHKAYPELDYGVRRSQGMRMPDLKIFTIMDVDMDYRSQNSYLSRDMFKDSPFYKRVVPILNQPDMDHVMEMMGMGEIQSKKTRSYARMADKIRDPREFYYKLESCNCTNMELFVQHCLSGRPSYQNQISPLPKLN